jgi:hypothetical protein
MQLLRAATSPDGVRPRDAVRGRFALRLVCDACAEYHQVGFTDPELKALDQEEGE